MAKRMYDPTALEDAPEFHPTAAALGTLTWGTWDRGVRPATERIADFIAAYPPEDPVRHVTGSLVRAADGSRAQSSAEVRLDRFLATDWRHGSVYELASRFGLRLRGGPERRERGFEPPDMKDTARRRNLRLRVLHGGVDVEPADMDAAKASALDTAEKRRAAEQVREARKRMNEELKKQ